MNDETLRPKRTRRLLLAAVGAGTALAACSSAAHGLSGAGQVIVSSDGGPDASDSGQRAIDAGEDTGAPDASTDADDQDADTDAGDQ